MGATVRGGAGHCRGRRGGPALALLLIALGSQSIPTPPPGYEEVVVGRVTVWARAPSVNLGIALAERADRPGQWPGLGSRTPPPFRLVLTPNRAAFSRLARGRVPAWGAGFTIPAARTIVIRLDAAAPTRTLQHELAHLILHDAVRGRVPLWFAEGYAVVAAGEWGRLDALQLNLAVASGQVPDLRTLDGALRDAGPRAEAAYALAGSAVLLLARRNPSGGLAPLIERLEAGTPFAAAVLATTGYSVDRFGEIWQKDVKRRYGILIWLMAGGLWLLAAVAVLFLRGWRRRADRPRRAALDRGWIVPAEAESDGQLHVPLDPEGPPRA